MTVNAYMKALELKPRYVRAFVNLGISCANQARYDEAARHYLKALTYVQAIHTFRDNSY